MPHFVIHCSKKVTEIDSPERIIQNVYDSAESTDLFDDGDIKVRIDSFQFYNNGNTKKDFIHVFGNIMEGRNTDQKASLSKVIISNLKAMFPNVPIISINIREFEASTYCNRSMV